MNPVMAMLMTGMTCVALITLVNVPVAPRRELASKEKLGKKLYFDENLSKPVCRSCTSCAGCHQDGQSSVAVGGLGERKAPTITYLVDCPPLARDAETGNFYGGLFWDGSVTGWQLGDPLTELVRVPLKHSVQKHCQPAVSIIAKVASTEYASLFEEAWGPGALSLAPSNLDLAFERIARSIAAFQRSPEMNPFSSKFDAYLANQTELTRQEKNGWELFQGKAKCANCHTATKEGTSEGPIFTDYSYSNLGIPPTGPAEKAGQGCWRAEFPCGKSRAAQKNGYSMDPGLGAVLAQVPKYRVYAEENLGKFKTPTLRNIKKRQAGRTYGHNGYFKSLKEVIHFLNTRDLSGTHSWAPPEWGVNLNTSDVGNLGLNEEEEAAILAFLGTLTDGYCKE